MRTGALARARLLDPASQVSCHYLVWEDGQIEQQVAEAKRAWHAGRSCWVDERDMNSVSIGIEIVNAGHDGGCPPYPKAQIDAVILLAKDICARHGIPSTRVLGHSDIAPGRKKDPGEWFPWQRLAQALCAGSHFARAKNMRPLQPGATCARVLELQRAVGAIGYDCPATGVYDEPTRHIVAAVQRRHRPALVDGIADGETLAVIEALRSTNVATP